MEPKKQKNKFSLGGGSKKPSNFYWIYAVIGLALISIQLINFGGSSSTITEIEFKNMVLSNHVQEVLVISNKKEVKVTLTPEALMKSITLSAACPVTNTTFFKPID